MECRLENRDTIVLHWLRRKVSLTYFRGHTQVQSRWGRPSRFVILLIGFGSHTFNMCSRVVFPALSRPRNSSFACLLSKPREERTS